MKVIIIAVMVLILIKSQPGLAALEKIQCRYYEHPTEGYTCELFITNPNGWDNFTLIEGDHVGSNRNGDVATIRRNVASFTTIIPSDVCNIFRNIVNFYYDNDYVHEISDNTFSSCVRLRNIILSNNRIENISADAFRQNSFLTWITMDRNYITDLPRELFLFTNSLSHLGMDRNFLRVVHADTFRIQPNFSVLRVNNNLISGFDERIVNNTNLWDLEIRGNSCVDANIIDQSPNRDMLRTVMRTCFTNYRARP